jgi:aminoglycoside phosphotransferase (APT) family kinase protein
VADLRAAGTLTGREARDAASVWREGVDAAPWAGVPVWVHGDLHPGNIVARGRELTGIIDFADVTGGDPAYDLAIAWLAFDGSGRERFIDATESRYTAADWTRARAWSVSMSLMLLLHSDDEPAYAALGRESLAEAL